MEQGIKTLHESNPNKKQKAKIVAVIAALYQAIKGGLCTDSNFPIQGDIFFFFFFKSNNPACGLDHGRDSGASCREAPYGPESRRKE